eukprot:scaffold3031_cov28-Tisochrysis_lutea.AAC.9
MPRHGRPQRGLARQAPSLGLPGAPKATRAHRPRQQQICGEPEGRRKTRRGEIERKAKFTGVLGGGERLDAGAILPELSQHGGVAVAAVGGSGRRCQDEIEPSV